MLALAGMAALPEPAAAETSRSSLHLLVPDQAKVQFAGALGLLSAGPGYAFANRRIELDLLVGWVPRSLAGVDLVTLTAKGTWLPWTVALQDWRLRPMTLGLALTYTAGDRFFVLLPDRYPSGYYPFPTALRATIAAGGTLGHALGSLQEAGVYWELVAVDTPFAYWIANRRTVPVASVFSLALGLRAAF